jgi:uncharacterized protein
VNTPLSNGVGHSAAGAWIGAIARLLAFAALLVTGTIVLATVASVAGGLPGGPILTGSLLTSVAAVAAGALLIRYADGRAVQALGIGFSRETVRHVGWGTAIGVMAMVTAVLALLVTRSLRYDVGSAAPGEWAAVVAAQAVIFTVAAFAEEAVFRGYPFQVLVQAAGPVIATIASSALFAVAHAGNPEVGPIALLNIFLAGILLAAAYLRTLSLWFATALHMGWNWSMATLFDLPVSGIQDFDTPGYQPLIGEPQWWSGGAFGPEGGLVGTLGFGVAVLAVLRFSRLRPDPAIAAARPLVLQGEGNRHDG